ncbi:type II secretion system protein N [Psychrobacter sp. I-STPA6b]|uniref:type II secretion system protein N n=1 Tax=Psychrobacter sp. I-STPA6b TaxID=2585718 RepID=UPI001D0C3D3A|nr:type II secretion system protein N [Psychrobacter sp. I-STPA6b]
MTTSASQIAKSAIVWVNRLSGWLLLLAIIWLCWSVARILWLILAPPVAPALPLLEKQPPPVLSTNTSNALTIFENEPSQPATPKRPPPQVTLKGVMIAQPSDLSSAMLEVEGKVANYRIGKFLADTGYKLIDVSWNQVIIADDSDNQVVIDMPPPLELNQNTAGASNSRGIGNHRLSASSGASVTTNNRLDEQMALDALDTDGALEGFQAEGGIEAPEQTEPDVNASLNQATEELKQNPASYLSRMGVMATGEGYQVTEAMPAHIRDRLGLEAGDRVLSVNGQNVGSNPAADADLLQQVKQSGEAQIEVRRGDQVINIRQQF